MTDNVTEIKTTLRARCFRGFNGGVGVLADYLVSVDWDGTVRVWDDIAGHYTVHHGMSAREESRVRRAAEQATKAIEDARALLAEIDGPQ